MNKNLKTSRRAAAALLLAAMASAGAWAQTTDGKGCAVVLLHGKWGSPQSVGAFGRKLLPLCVVKAPEMPWAQRRGYDKDYPTALREIGAQVKDFRQQGYKRILVVGHSFGANAAIAYAAEAGDVDGVVALAPGHSPRLMYERAGSREAVDQARKLVAAGKPAERLSIEDLNQGTKRNISMAAGVMLSYFDPQGLGDMPSTAPRVRQHIPLLWVIGTGDPLYAQGETYAYAKAPPHPLGRYVVVQADHAGTPDAAVKPVLEWIKSLE